MNHAGSMFNATQSRMPGNKTHSTTAEPTLTAYNLWEAWGPVFHQPLGGAPRGRAAGYQLVIHLRFPHGKHFKIEFLERVACRQVPRDELKRPGLLASGLETPNVETAGAEHVESRGHGRPNACFADWVDGFSAWIQGQVIDAVVRCF